MTAYLKAAEDKYKTGDPDWEVWGFGDAEMWTGNVEIDNMVYLRVPTVLDMVAEYKVWEDQRILSETEKEFWQHLITKGAENITVQHWID